MTDTDVAATSPVSVEEMQQGWRELNLRVAQLEAEKTKLEQEHTILRHLVERLIDHRQKSHNELVLILTSLVGKLPLNDVGIIIAKLVEHNTNASQYMAALLKGTAEPQAPTPDILKTLDQLKRDLLASIKPVVEELICLDTPLETEALQGLLEQPDSFFTPRIVRANRCFVKGFVPRERIFKEFGPEALVFFNDMTTDAKLNPHPKAEEIALGFKNDFEALFQQNPTVLPDKRQELLALYQRVQRSKTPETAHAQRNAFQRLSFLLELLHFYQHQDTEAPDALFAQRLPNLVEQLVFNGPQDRLDEKLIATAEHLMAYVIRPDHRQMIINNVGKGSVAGKTLSFVLRLRAEKVLASDPDHVLTDFVKLLISPQKPPAAAELTPILRLLQPDTQRLLVKAIVRYDRLRKEEAEALGKALGETLGLQGVLQEIKTANQLTPEVERQLAWVKIKDLISQRSDPATVAGAIRDRLNARYDADEIRQSWITLTEADPMALIRIFCQVPYLPSGKTDPIARTVLQSYVTRLTHEKYAATYQKVVNSLRNMFKAKPDSPTLLNFVALVRWADPEAGNRICTDVGIPVSA
jgi:hypothetical protein